MPFGQYLQSKAYRCSSYVRPYRSSLRRACYLVVSMLKDIFLIIDRITIKRAALIIQHRKPLYRRPVTPCACPESEMRRIHEARRPNPRSRLRVSSVKAADSDAGSAASADARSAEASAERRRSAAWTALNLGGGQTGFSQGCRIMVIIRHHFLPSDCHGQAAGTHPVHDHRATHCRHAPPQGPWARAT